METIIIERKFGETKDSHGLGRRRYIGMVRPAIQAILTVMALNLKRLVKVLTGVGYKTSATASAC